MLLRLFYDFVCTFIWGMFHFWGNEMGVLSFFLYINYRFCPSFFWGERDADLFSWPYLNILPPVFLNAQGNSLVVQWLGLWASTTGGTGLIHGQRTKIPQATQLGQTNQQKTSQYFLRKINMQIQPVQILCVRLYIYFKTQTMYKESLQCKTKAPVLRAECVAWPILC